MTTPSPNILVVDDTKFSSVLIGRTLHQAGYTEIRYASNAADALTLIEQKPADILIVDWLMPEMDGLELSLQIRKKDSDNARYTYIILLTGKDGDDVIEHAFSKGVDDFISKTAMNEQLLPRIHAAERLNQHISRLTQKTLALTHKVQHLESINTTDPVTGLGNKRELNRSLSKSLSQLESREGKLCFILISLDNIADIQRKHGPRIHSELLRSVSQRLEQLVRPLDTLIRIDGSQFALINLLEKNKECTASSYKRLHDAINLKPCKTSQGFISLQASICLLTLTAGVLPCTPEAILNFARTVLPQSRNEGRIAHQAIDRPLT